MKTHPLLFLILMTAASGRELGFTGVQEIIGSSEAITSGDITTQNHQLNYSGIEGPWTLSAGFGYSDYRLDYAPGATGGVPEDLAENTQQYSLGLRRKWNEQWSSSVNLGAYEGFGEYRSIWISEYYRQEFIGFPEAYAAPDPHGESVGHP